MCTFDYRQKEFYRKMEARSFGGCFLHKKIRLVVSFFLPFVLLLSACCREEDDVYQTIRLRVESVSETNLNEMESIVMDAYFFLNRYPQSKYRKEVDHYIENLRDLEVNGLMRLSAEITSTAYPSLDEALMAPDGYLSFWMKNERILLQRDSSLEVHTANVMEHIRLIREMRKFLDKEYSTLAILQENVEAMKVFSESDLRSIRDTWSKLLQEKRGVVAQMQLEKTAKLYAEERLRQYVLSVCANSYHHYNVKEVVLVASQPILELKADSVECSATYRVMLVGSFLGWDRGTAKILVRGRFSVEQNEAGIPVDIYFVEGDFSVLETTGRVR